jgi:hypothetical protein
MLPIYLYKKIMLEKKASSNLYQQALLTKLAGYDSLADVLGKPSDIATPNTGGAPPATPDTSRTAPATSGVGKSSWWRRGGRLGILLGSILAGYGALSAAQPYFVRKLRESAYRGPNDNPDISKIYTTPTKGFREAVQSTNSKEEMDKIFQAIQQRFEQLQKGNYAPYIFEPVTGSYSDYRNKSTLFSPLWNALRYINVFNSRSAPVYERHYTTPREFVASLERYADRIERGLKASRTTMGIEKQIEAQNYLNHLRHMIEEYNAILNMREGGGAGGGGVGDDGV